MAKKRPKLTDTPIARRVAAKAAVESAAPADVGLKRSGRPEGAKAVLVQMNREGWRALNDLSLDLDTSLQKLGVEAWNDLLVKHGRPAVIVNPFGQRVVKLPAE